MERYRDNSFDFDTLLGNGTPKRSKNLKTPRNLSLKLESSIENGQYRKGETFKKVEKLERYEVEKMNNLMSGIIERSNAKMQKMGISPSKAVKFF